MAEFSGKIIEAYFSNSEKDTICIMWNNDAGEKETLEEFIGDNAGGKRFTSVNHLEKHLDNYKIFPYRDNSIDQVNSDKYYYYSLMTDAEKEQLMSSIEETVNELQDHNDNILSKIN